MSTKRQAPLPDPASDVDAEEPVTSSFLKNLIGGLSTDLGSQIRDMQGLVVAQGQVLTTHAAKLDDHTAQLQQCCRHVDELRDRLALQERKTSTEGSTAPPSTSPGEIVPDKRPLLVIGGWEPDTRADDVIAAAQRALTDGGLAEQLDLSRMFVPGPRRGFALIPLTDKGAPLTHPLLLATNTLLQQFRSHRLKTASGRNIFLTWSVPPEMRKKSAFAGKVKRCIMTIVQNPPPVEVEWRAGCVWAQGIRIASASTPPPSGDNIEVLPTAAWLDLGQLSQILKVPLPDLTKHWAELAKLL